MAKAITTRIQNKHDVEANWNKATNFKPLKGEVIIYEPDSTHKNSRMKIGDGNTAVTNLPFVIDNKVPAASSLLENVNPDDVLDVKYATQSNGWNLSLASMSGGSPVGTCWVNDWQSGVRKYYSKLIKFTPNGNYRATFQKIAGEDWAGDFEFDTPVLKPIIYNNWDFSEGEKYWNFASSASLTTDPTGEHTGQILKNVGSGSSSSATSIITSNAYSFETGKTYELSFRFYCYDTHDTPTLAVRTAYTQTNLLEVICPTAESTVLGLGSNKYDARINLNQATCNMWHDATIRFTAKSNYTTAFSIRHYKSNAGKFYISNIVLKDDTNYMENFNSWTASSYYHPHEISNNVLTTKSDTASSASNPTGYITLAKCEGLVIPNTYNSFEFGVYAKRLTRSFIWQDYITLTPSDKFNILNNSSLVPSECLDAPCLSGPWASNYEPPHGLKCIINCETLKASYAEVSFVGNSGNSHNFTVNLLKNKVLVDTKTYVFDRGDHTEYANYILPISLEDGYDKIEIIAYLENAAVQDIKDLNAIKSIRLFGTRSGRADNIRALTNIQRDFHGNIKCFGITADNYWGAIDDGYLNKGAD